MWGTMINTFGDKRNSVKVSRIKEVGVECGYLDIKTKQVVHQPVCFNRIWKNALQSREKERLKRLSCQMLAINFDCNSAAMNLCVRSGQ